MAIRCFGKTINSKTHSELVLLLVGKILNYYCIIISVAVMLWVQNMCSLELWEFLAPSRRHWLGWVIYAGLELGCLLCEVEDLYSNDVENGLVRLSPPPCSILRSIITLCPPVWFRVMGMHGMVIQSSWDSWTHALKSDQVLFTHFDWTALIRHSIMAEVILDQGWKYCAILSFHHVLHFCIGFGHIYE